MRDAPRRYRAVPHAVGVRAPLGVRAAVRFRTAGGFRASDVHGFRHGRPFGYARARHGRAERDPCRHAESEFVDLRPGHVHAALERARLNAERHFGQAMNMQSP